MKALVSSVFLLFIIGAVAQKDAGWLRHSVIAPDGSAIVFTYKGDLYKVSSQGGDAQQLTFHDAHDYQAVWSRDSKTLAFASNRYGNFDIYTMSATGGSAIRLTFHSNDEQPYSFTAAGDAVLFGASRMDVAAHRQFPTGSQPEVYSVSVKGGRVNQVFTLPAEAIAISNDAKTMLYQDKKGGENFWRKHHTSSITRDIWSYDVATKKHRMLTTFKGEDRQPVYGHTDEMMYYLSEQSGSFNVHKMNLGNPSEITQLTQFKMHPIRFLSYGNGLLSFSWDGKLFTMKEGEQPKQLVVNIITQQTQNSDKIISVNGGVTQMEVSPSGKEIAFIARGEVFVTSISESFTKRLTNTPENERFVTWNPDGKSVVYSSERNGKWSVFKTEKVRDDESFFFAATLLKETPVLENGKDNYLAQYAPDGKQLAFIEDRRTLKVKDLNTGTEIILLTAQDLYHMGDGDKYFKWSPDSKWLLVEWGKTLSNSDVLLMAADGSKRLNLNESGYYDVTPQWVNEGKQMLWFSNRDGLKSYATSGSTQTDAYSMFFNQEAWDEFNLSKEDYALQKEIKELAEKAKKTDDEDSKKKKNKKAIDPDNDKVVKALTFDMEDMKDRTKRLTIHSSDLSDAVFSKDGDKLYYLTKFEDKLDLWSTDFRSKETKMILKLSATSGSLEWDAKRENLFLLSSGKIFKIDPEKAKKESVDLAAEMLYDATDERQAMFDHVWIRTNAVFYHSNFHGVDWNLMKKEFEKHLPYLGNSNEFTELLSEMLGELNVSHAGASAANFDVSNGDETASLGIFIDYEHSGDGIKITEILKGGPLDKAGFNLKAGIIIEKIDGELITADKDIAQFLNRKANDFTLLELVNPETKTNQTITVKPISLGQERALLYKRWVKINEKEVEEKSGGALGYVHIPGMSDGPYRDIYEKMMGKYSDRKAMIIDTRFNGGGDLVADLATFFTGKPFISYETEQKVVGGEPTSRWTKPTLAMINEAQYSDGHCFASGYTDLKIGKTVGMPTPGTCSFAGWERLPDGSRWGVVPVSAKDIKGNWMENNQTEPDIIVKNAPGAIDEGKDQQLERAIEELMKEVK
jgi:C-terminal processing protease CtpA/Prc/WD40 repeat protein